MSSVLKLAAVAVLALAIGVGLGPLLRSGNNVGSDPSPSPTPARLGSGPLPAGTYVTTPFAHPGSQNDALCKVPPQPGCSETTADDGISFTFSVPDGWAGAEGKGLLNSNDAPPGGAAMLFFRGAWLFERILC